MSTEESASGASANSTDKPQQLVLRNTAFVVAAQIVVTPLTIIINAIVARKLGAVQFGQLYLATNFAAFAMLFIEWGHSGALTGGVARDRSRAGVLLGSSLTWRYSAALLASGVLIAGCALLGYDHAFLTVLSLALLASVIGTYTFACLDVFRGYERTDFGAITYVGWQAFSAVIIIPVMLLGGELHSLLLAQAFCAAAGALCMWQLLKPMGVPRLQVSRETLVELFKAGTPFLIFGLVLALQTNIDALLLSKFGSAESVGWHAVARKLTGLLVFPANALIAALYPTLCRLYAQDKSAFRSTAASALQLTALVAMPIALSCALFPDIGVRIFSIDEYGAAADNLRILAPCVLLVYFSMPLSCALTASGKQRPWSIAQVVCLAIGATLDFLLIPWFQTHHGNGGLGVCIATLSSEVVMVSVGLSLLPGGILNAALRRKLLAALTGAICMGVVAWLLHTFNSFFAAPFALLAYALGVWLAGGIDPALIGKSRALLHGQAIEQDSGAL